MSLKINSNVGSLITHRHLQKNSDDLSKSLEKLASGLKLNRASDGPANLVIAENMRAQNAGLKQAIDNNEVAVSLVQTAEGALNEVANTLIAIRQRAVASANEGVNDEAMLAANQQEIENALSSIDIVATSTQFGRKKLLDGSGSSSATATGTGLEFVSVSGGAKKSGPEGYDVVIFQEGKQASFGGGTAISQGMIDGGEELTIQEGGRTASLKLDNTYTVESAIKKLNDIAEKNGLEVTVENNGGSIGVTHNKYGAEYSFLLRSTTPGVLSKGTGDPSIIKNGSDVSGLINGESAIGRGQDLTGRRGNATTEGLTVRWKGAEGVAIAGKPSGTQVGKISIREGFRFQVGANPDQAVSVAMGNMSSSQLARGVKNESGFQSLADLDVRTTSGANDAIRIVDEAISQVAITRGSLGAFQRNTLESNLTSLRIASENMTSAESTIRDADMAKELATFTRNQIMTQSAMAQLAQANAMPQNVLRLLANQ